MKTELPKFSWSKYIKVGDRYFPIVHRRKGKQFNCPYCDELHEHGSAEGHRNTHCSNGRPKRILVNSEINMEWSSHDGYYIEDI